MKDNRKMVCGELFKETKILEADYLCKEPPRRAECSSGMSHSSFHGYIDYPHCPPCPAVCFKIAHKRVRLKKSSPTDQRILPRCNILTGN